MVAEAETKMSLAEAARELSEINREYEPEIVRTYWFDDPDGREVRLVHVYSEKPATSRGVLRPFYSGKSSQSGLPYRSAVGLISRYEDDETLQLPESWGVWSDAIRWERK